MKFTLPIKQFDTLQSLNGISGFLSRIQRETSIVNFDVSDVSGFQDEIFFNIVEDGMDREGAVNAQGKEWYHVYDELLAQIHHP